MPNIKLIYSIIHYLKDVLAAEHDPDIKESVEVAVQCLMTAYDLNAAESRVKSTGLTCGLEEIFDAASNVVENDVSVESGCASQNVNQADMMKNLGNNMMKTNRFEEAIKYYSSAINLDSKNAVYYCNRAAAYSKLNDHHNSIKDCESALKIDPKYAKAYGRLGLAYSSINQDDAAANAFKKAVELDPENESYQDYLKSVSEKKAKPPTASSAPPNSGGPFNLGGIDLGSIFNNPVLQNAAANLMQNPQLFNILSAGMNQAAAGLNNPSADGSNSTNSSDGNNRGMDILLEAGQLLTQQMEASNPGLLEQLRQSTRNARPPTEDDRKDPGA